MRSTEPMGSDGWGRLRARLAGETGAGETMIATLVLIAWIVIFVLLTFYILDAASGGGAAPPANLSGR